MSRKGRLRGPGVCMCRGVLQTKQCDENQKRHINQRAYATERRSTQSGCNLGLRTNPTEVQNGEGPGHQQALVLFTPCSEQASAQPGVKARRSAPRAVRFIYQLALSRLFRAARQKVMPLRSYSLRPLSHKIPTQFVAVPSPCNCLLRFWPASLSH